MTTKEFNSILEALESGAKDAIDSKDYLSYSTLLDVYLNEVEKYSNEEKEELLSHLLKILNENELLTYEIGWDIPQLLLLYIESDYKFEGALKQAPCVYKVMKIFEVLSLKGNAKELFLKSCEILSNLDMKSAEEENWFEVKFYCIFELIDSSLKRIQTLYPSRFLSLTISSFINMVYKLVKKDVTRGNSHFIMRRAYSFARGYRSLPLPKNDSSKEELDKIKEDENYLQRKLLTSFITQVVYLFGIHSTEGFSIEQFVFLQSNQEQEEEYDGILNRLAELSLSFDIYLEKIFKQFLIDSHVIFNKFDYENEDISSEIFEKVVIDYQSNILTSLTDSDAKQINDAVLGELYMFTSQISTSKNYDSPNVTFNDALVLSLRLLIPQMVNSTFHHLATQDLCIFWAWFAIHQSSLQNKKLELELSRIPKILLTTYYQLILFVLNQCERRPNCRYILLTLMTKLLILSPENIGYEFIKDTLENCPYESVKAALIGVYKVLLLKDKEVDVSKLSLDLPKRDQPKSDKYYTLTEERLNDLLEHLLVTQSDTFIEDAINPSKFSTLAAYLNLFVGLKREPMIIENKSKINKVFNSVSKNIQSIKGKENKENQFEQNAAGMLELTIERFKE
ncbi:unnamed protein product [Candida verbasci]|uniref:Uncharacterized protein n=1 Tax=Candida verbasci TaxID=1227364 RepID=A0A9W4TTK2_9ASCO|nr:unnamed protein product [Candida verbasci]